MSSLEDLDQFGRGEAESKIVQDTDLSLGDVGSVFRVRRAAFTLTTFVNFTTSTNITYIITFTTLVTFTSFIISGDPSNVESWGEVETNSGRR